MSIQSHSQASTNVDDLSAGLGSNPCITVTVGGHRFGIPIARVEDVFVATAVTPVPKASAEIVGLLNLRGKVVTAISLAARLGLKAEPVGAGGSMTAIGVGHGGETFGLVVSAVGEVVELPVPRREPVPPHFDARWATLAVGVHQREDGLLVELDVDALLEITPRADAA